MSDHNTLLTTPLNALHLELAARMVPFAGYSMPVQSPAGLMAEHAHTRNAAGTCIVFVKLTACVDHHAVCICQQRKVACASNGTTEAIQLLLGGLQHRLVDFLQALNLSAAHRLKRHLLRWRVPPCQAAFP